MQLCKLQLSNGDIRVGVLEQKQVHLLDLSQGVGLHTLADVLHSEHPRTLIADLRDDEVAPIAIREVTWLPPIDRQEVWAAGVTYVRSREARERESTSAARSYDLVYSAERPELFFKATPHRVVGCGGRVHIRRDARWSVPEPELTLVLNPQLKLVGYTIGNDMSSRDIEGENPLYLPQAKVYDNCCALGPVITLTEDMPPLEKVQIRLQISRRDRTVFDGSTSISAMHRTLKDLVSWLGRDNSFPNGAFLLTGTGIVPPDDFTLQPGDLVHIDITGIGRLTNPVTYKGEV